MDKYVLRPSAEMEIWVGIREKCNRMEVLLTEAKTNKNLKKIVSPSLTGLHEFILYVIVTVNEGIKV